MSAQLLTKRFVRRSARQLTMFSPRIRMRNYNSQNDKRRRWAPDYTIFYHEGGSVVATTLFHRFVHQALS